MPQLCFNGSRTDPQLVAARGFARTSPHATRRLYIKVRADQQDAGTPPQPQQPPTSQPKRLLSPPSRQARQAVAQPPSSIPRIRWRQGQQKGPSLTPQQPDASKPTTPATPQQLATPAHPGKHPPDDAAQVEQQQQQMDAGAMPPAEGPAERSTPAAPSKAGVAALQPPNAPLPEPQPYLQQQQQVYTRTEQQQHTQRRQELEVQLQQQQQQQRLQEHTAGSAAGPGHKGGAKQQADSRVAPPDGSESYSATSSSSSSSSGGSREKVISVAPQHRRPPPQPSSFTPIHQVSKHTTVHALGGALAAESALSPHQLLLAWGPEAVNIAVKGCATARRKLQEAGGSAHQTVVTRGRHRSDSAAAAGGEQQQGWDLLVQPTLRGHGVGTAAVALDVIRIPQGAGAFSAWRPGKEASAAGVVFRRIASTSNEHMWARSLAANMPARHQTVLTLCGAAAVLNAVLAVALARDLLRRSTGCDLVLLPQWGYSRAHKRDVGLQLVVMCCTDEFPPQLVVGRSRGLADMPQGKGTTVQGS